MKEKRIKDGAGTAEASVATTAARARRLWELGAFERARTLVAELPAGSPDGALARADFHLHVGELADALSAYRHAARLAPRSVHAARGEAATRLNLDDPQAALEAAERAHALAEATPGLAAAERANVLTVLAGAQGLVAERGGFFAKLRHGLAVRTGFEQAVALDATNPYARTGLGRFFLAAPAALGGDPAAGLAALEAAMTQAPFYYLTHAWYVRALEVNGAAEEAARQRAVYRERYAAYPAALAELEGPT